MPHSGDASIAYQTRLLPTIRVPTIVVPARGDRMVALQRGREVAALIPGARFIERAALDRWRGQEIKTSGDGFLATFDGPARAVRCAAEIVESVAALGLSVVGFSLRFADRGDYVLRGVSDPWRLYALER
jgi:hypothetical protein